MSFDFDRLAEALIGGAARKPSRPRRRASTPLIRGRGAEAQAVRALASLAGMAFEALTKSAEAPPPPAKPLPVPPMKRDPGGASPWGPAYTGGGRRLPDIAPPPPPAPRAEQAESLVLIRAMVAAAAADGAVDRAERLAIAGQLDSAGLSPAERDLVLADLDRPATPEALAAEVSDPMQAAQIYAAAVAIAGDLSAAERGFLDRLRAALTLSPAAAAAIEARLAGEHRP